MTVAELLERMDAAEFGEWMAYWEDEPFGGVVDDFRAGLVAATAANHGFNPPKRARGPMDFFPWHDREHDMTDDEHAAAVDELLSRAMR